MADEKNTETPAPETAAPETAVNTAEATTVTDLADLKDIAGDAPNADAATAENVVVETMPLREQELDGQGAPMQQADAKTLLPGFGLSLARVW